jgi:hypothetical protein
MIYVDNLIHPWKAKLWCHLVADDLQELHDFATKLGLKREWFQNHRIQPHYDLTAAKREMAIRLGARQITTSESSERVLEILKARREGKNV